MAGGVASLAVDENCFACRLSVGGFVWRFRGSGRAIVFSRSRWIGSLLIFWPRTKTEIWTIKNFFFISHAEWKTLQLVSLPQFQFALIRWMKRPVFDVFDCSFVPDCFLLQFSLFLCCSKSRSPRTSEGPPSKRSGCTVTDSWATSFGQFARVWRLQHPSPSPGAREAGSLFLSLLVEPQLLPFSRHVAEQTGNKSKTSQTRLLCVVAVYLPLYQAVTFPKMIDGISLRFRFDRPFERLFRN